MIGAAKVIVFQKSVYTIMKIRLRHEMTVSEIRLIHVMFDSLSAKLGGDVREVRWRQSADFE